MFAVYSCISVTIFISFEPVGFILKIINKLVEKYMRCMKKVICVDCAVGMKECNYLVIAFHKFISCRHEVIKRLDCFFYLNLTRKLSEIIYTFLE